jgi:hypothetical protein
MLYCSLDEASNKSFKNKLEQYDEIHKFDNYNDINITYPQQQNNSQVYPSYFTAQGDYASNKEGTTINQLKNNYSNNIDLNNEQNNNQSIVDSLSFDNDTNFTDDITLASKFKKKDLDHDYCVNIITKELLSNNGDASLMSSHNGKIYKHVKTCTICKNKIKKIMKEQYCSNDDNNIINKLNGIEHFAEEQHTQLNIIGYDIKELILIILGGIILIFIFDLLVRMGSKLK